MPDWKMVMEIAPGIYVFDDVFLSSAAYINQINEQGVKWSPSEVLTNPETGSSGQYTKARDTDVIMLHDNVTGVVKDFKQAFNDNVQPKVDEYIKEYYATIVKKEPPQLLRYGAGQHFHNHIDDHPSLGVRRISLSYYINNDYEGGEIEFPRFNLKIKPKANQLIIFPSNYVYNHLVHAVTSGFRYVVVQWMS